MKWLEMLFTLLSALLALAAVLALAYITLKWMGSKMPGTTGGGGGRMIRVLDRVMVGQNKCLLVVRVGKQTILIGMAEDTVQKLCDLPELDDWEPPENRQNTPEFSELLRDAVTRGWGKLGKKGGEEL